MKYVQSWQWRYQSDIIRVVLVPLLLTFNIFHALFKCSYCYCWLGSWLARKMFSFFFMTVSQPPLVWTFHVHDTFFSKKIFCKVMNLKNPKTFRTLSENIQPQMPEQQFLKVLIFPRALEKFQNYVNFSIFLWRWTLVFIVNIYVRKWRLLAMLNLTKWTTKKKRKR